MATRVEPVVDDSKLLTVFDVAEILGVSDRHVRKLSASGEDRLPVVRVGVAMRYRRSDVQAWIDRQTAK
ncbi:MAG: helix-turn-helix domain-containing protein [Pirellulales bacterium]